MCQGTGCLTCSHAEGRESAAGAAEARLRWLMSTSCDSYWCFWRRRQLNTVWELDNRKLAKTHACVCASNLTPELQPALQRSTGAVQDRGRCSRSRQKVHCTSRYRISVGEGRKMWGDWGEMSTIFIVNNKQNKINIKMLSTWQRSSKLWNITHQNWITWWW